MLSKQFFKKETGRYSDNAQYLHTVMLNSRSIVGKIITFFLCRSIHYFKIILTVLAVLLESKQQRNIYINANITGS